VIVDTALAIRRRIALGFRVDREHNLFMITVLYFARLRESLGTGLEQLAVSNTIRNVDGLRAHLAARGGVWAQEFASGKKVRAAVNQTVAQGDEGIADGDEVAFFPPVTGG